MTDANFDTCLKLILLEEGGNSDDPHDPGGRTSRGIIQTEYNAYRRKHGLPPQSVYDATDQEVADIYMQSYWLPDCPAMPTGVDLVFFDMAVNAGPARAAKLLQRALGVPEDGRIGPVTMEALVAAHPIKVIMAFSDTRRAYYKSLATFKYFGKGWLNRVATIENAAIKMAAAV